MTKITLNPGDQAPSFTLRNQDDAEVSLEQFRGSRVILFCYPAAMTPGCTKEACDFRDAIEPLQAAGYTVLGLSPDQPEKLRRFQQRDSLPYDLLSDPEHDTLKAYGAYGKKNMYGKLFDGVIRSTFVIDEAGTIEHALYNVRATGHVARIRSLLGV